MSIVTYPVLIGDLLVRSEMTTAVSIADAVPVSLKTGVPIGRILIGSGAISEAGLQQALLAQSLIRDSLLTMSQAVDALKVCAKEHFTLEQALKIVGWQPEPFTHENKLGQLLLSAEVITQQQLDEALRVFYSAGLPLARVLVKKGIISNLVAYTALSSQQLLRDGKLTRDQAVQAVTGAVRSNAVIQDDYVKGYLRLSPTNHLRLGELLILAKLISEESLIAAVETALRKGETLGEVLVAAGLIGNDTMERALQTQRLVAEDKLDIAHASDMLRKADYEKIPLLQAMQNQAPAVLLSSVNIAVETEFIAVEDDLIPINFEGASSLRKKRSHEEAHARQLLTRMLAKLEALYIRNNYLLSTIDKHANNDQQPSNLHDIQRRVQMVTDFDDSIEAIQSLLTHLETASYQNGFLRARLDAVAVESELLGKLGTAEQAIKRLSGRMTKKTRSGETADGRLPKLITKAAKETPPKSKARSRKAPVEKASAVAPKSRPAKKGSAKSKAKARSKNSRLSKPSSKTPANRWGRATKSGVTAKSARPTTKSSDKKSKPERTAVKSSTRRSLKSAGAHRTRRAR